MTRDDPRPFAPRTPGERIGHARRLLGVFEGRDVLVPDLAKRVGVTAESVYNWESDDAVPGRANFAKLAAVLRVSVAWLHYAADAEPAPDGPPLVKHDVEATRQRQAAKRAAAQHEAAGGRRGPSRRPKSQ